MSGRAAARRLSLAGQPQGLPVVHSGRHVDGELARLRLRARAAAGLTPLLDRAALAAAARTGGLDHEEALRVQDLTLAAADLAVLALGARLGAAAVAGLARFVARDLDLTRDAVHRLGEAELDVDLQI